MVLVCAKCGHENPGTVSICANCAAPLANLCPNCGFENPIGFKFCGMCGANLLTAALARGSEAQVLRRMQSHIPGDLVEKVLRAGQQLEGDRRNVTILFSDMVGFTTLSEKLDPEQVYSIIDQTQKAFLNEIYAHEGWFDKFMGDGLMAIFGAPVSHEDDPARAVRAALRMQAALRRINQDLDPRLDITLRMRIGLNAGSVVVANLGSDLKMNYTPLGDAVNVASRLQSVAEPDAILASRAVYDACHPLFEFRELGSIRVKGRVEPVEIFEVAGLKRQPGRTRGIQGLNAPMVGRSEPLARLRRVADATMSGPGGQMALITGEAGIGKSRLTAELKSYLADKPITIVEGACLAYGQSSYDVVTSLLKALLEITPDDSEATARERVEAHLTRLLGSGPARSQVLPYLEYLLSIPVVEREMADRIRYLEPAQLRQQVFLAVRDFLAAQARARPLLLVFEDLHWVDKPSLDLLLFLLHSVESAPLFFYCTSRPTEGQAVVQLERLGRSALGARYVRVELQRLSMADSVALVDLLLTIADLPQGLKELIPQRAEGNPFYLEEIIRMLIDRGVIRQGEGHWEMSPGADMSNLEVPRTLQGLIMTRVDNLREGPRHALQCAAVIGRTFTKRLLSFVLDSAYATAELDLQELGEREIVAPISETPDREYSFRHVLIQETVYSSLLSRRRERLHHRIAEGIEQLYRDHLDDFIERLAFHYQESRDLSRALPYLIRAGERAANRYANEVAITYYQAAQEALAVAEATPAQRIAVYAGLADVQYVIGNYDGALSSYRHALDVAQLPGQGTPRQIAELERKMGRVHERKGDYSESLRWLETALSELDRDKTSARSVERVRLYLDTGWVHYRRGELEDAYQWPIKSLQIGEGSDEYVETGTAYNRLVPLFVAKGDWVRARAYGEKGLQVRERIGDTEGMARSYLSLGGIAGYQGEWDKAIEYNERGLEIAQRIGRAYSITLALGNLGYVYILQGDSARARTYLDRGLHEAEKSGDAHQICIMLNNLALAALLDKNSEEALATAEKSLLRATETGNKADLADAHSLLAAAQLERGETAQAEAAAMRGVEIAQEAGLVREEGLARRALGAVRRAQGQWAEAELLFKRSLDLFQQLNNRYEGARTQLEIARLHRAQGAAGAARREAELALDTFTTLGAEGDRRQARALLQELDSPKVRERT